MTESGINTNLPIECKVLNVLAAGRSLAAARNGVHASEGSSNQDKQPGRVFVSDTEMPIFCELLIENVGGVRKVARLFDINSGLVTMARGGYYAPAFLDALAITRNPFRKRWIADTDEATFTFLETMRGEFGITRRKMLNLFAAYLKSNNDAREYFMEHSHDT